MRKWNNLLPRMNTAELAWVRSIDQDDSSARSGERPCRAIPANRTLFPLILCINLLLLCLGCTNKDTSLLTQSKDALEQQQFEQAQAKADDYLRKHPREEGSADALYLRGRALEARPAPSPAAAAANLQAARSSYIAALSAQPGKKTEAYIRASLGNVAFFQDDYTTAAQQWAAAFDQLDRDDLKSWTLYRIGLSQQRLGQFTQADQTFARVRKDYPGTIPAQRASEHQGARQFYIQLATFRLAASADAAASDVRKVGLNPIRLTDSKGYSLLRVGPFRSYSEAKAQRARFVDKYPDALILP